MSSKTVRKKIASSKSHKKFSVNLTGINKITIFLNNLENPESFSIEWARAIKRVKFYRI